MIQLENQRSKRAILAEWFALQAFRLRSNESQIGNYKICWFIPIESQEHVSIVLKDDKNKNTGTFIHLGPYKIKQLSSSPTGSQTELDEITELRRFLSDAIGEKPAKKLRKKIYRSTRRKQYLKPFYRAAEKTFMGISRSLSKSERSRG